MLRKMNNRKITLRLQHGNGFSPRETTDYSTRERGITQILLKNERIVACREEDDDNQDNVQVIALIREWKTRPA